MLCIIIFLFCFILFWYFFLFRYRCSPIIIDFERLWKSNTDFARKISFSDRVSVHAFKYFPHNTCGSMKGGSSRVLVKKSCLDTNKRRSEGRQRCVDRYFWTAFHAESQYPELQSTEHLIVLFKSLFEIVQLT